MSKILTDELYNTPTYMSSKKKKTECLSTQGQSLPLISLRFDFALMGIKWYNLFWGDNTKMMKKRFPRELA